MKVAGFNRVGSFWALCEYIMPRGDGRVKIYVRCLPAYYLLQTQHSVQWLKIITG